MRAHTIHETLVFKRGGDPYNKLGIGPKGKIDNWFNQWAPDADYEIDDNLNIIVNGHLDFIYSDITELPDNLIVNGYLDLRYTNITELPDNLTVNRSLDLMGSKIIELPDNLIVGRDLNIRFTMIPKLPDNLNVKGKIIY